MPFFIHNKESSRSYATFEILQFSRIQLSKIVLGTLKNDGRRGGSVRREQQRLGRRDLSQAATKDSDRRPREHRYQSAGQLFHCLTTYQPHPPLLAREPAKRGRMANSSAAERRVLALIVSREMGLVLATAASCCVARLLKGNSRRFLADICGLIDIDRQRWSGNREDNSSFNLYVGNRAERQILAFKT